MQTKTLILSPGSVEEITFAQPTDVTFLMTDANDVVWLATAHGALDIDAAVRLDKSQCPLQQRWSGYLGIHSPAQAGRTVQVSLVIGGVS